MQRDIKVIEYDIIGSTNAEAKKYALAAESSDPVLFVAREQSAGRGRMGRSFLSRRERGIYMSLLYFTDSGLCDAVSVTTAAAVYAALAIEAAAGIEIKIKWVNDLYYRGGKAAGILVESVKAEQGNAIIVGIGINTGEGGFPEELSGIASSIGEISEGQRREMIDRIAKGILLHAYSPLDVRYMEEYRKRFMLEGKCISLYSAGEKTGEGRVMGVDDRGGLMVLLDGDDEVSVIRTGEVSVREI